MSLVIKGTVEEAIRRIRKLGLAESEQLTITIERPKEDSPVYLHGIRQFASKDPEVKVSDRMIKDLMAEL